METKPVHGRLFVVYGRTPRYGLRLGRNEVVEDVSYMVDIPHNRGRCLRLQLGRLYFGVGVYDRDKEVSLDQLLAWEEEAVWLDSVPAEQIGRWRGGADAEEAALLGYEYQAPEAAGPDERDRAEGLGAGLDRPGDEGDGPGDLPQPVGFAG